MKLVRLTALATFAPLLMACFDSAPETTAAEAEPPTQSQTHALVAFDFDNGDIASDYLIPNIIPFLLQNFGPSDASLVLYTTSTVVTSWFDAISPYSETMVGVFSHLPRRPASEGLTNRNRNIAIMHASLHTLTATNPRNRANWRQILIDVGLNPDDNSSDLSTAVGIGNTAGKAVVAGRARDGFNRDGDEGGEKYNLKRYYDYTGYEPFNTAFDLKDPDRWQPKIVTQGGGLFQIQKSVTPQWGKTKAFSYDDAKAFSAPAPTAKWRSNPNAYRQQVDEVIDASANLTDYQKMSAEFFNHKFASLGRGGDFVRRKHGMSLERFVQYDFLLQVASFDGGIVTWQEKAKYDTVRPWSAIRFLYGKKKLRAWGGPGKGTVNDITGNEWESYLPVADHPEYPSGSSCFCAAHAQASRRFLGTDEFGWTVARPRGSSTIEPGITPAQDVTLDYPTFTAFEAECGKSRLWGGVHFKSAYEEGRELCGPIGDLAYEFADRHIRGDVP